jgi:hypothetical protein
MSTIRPFTPPAAPARPAAVARPAVGTPEPVRAAQRAFFQAALDGEPPQAARAEPQRRVEPKPLDRLPRPGSLLDIKV